MNVLAVFRSRLEAVKVYEWLSARGIPSSVVGTPTYLNMGCGLSVSINNNNVSDVRLAVSVLNLKKFEGIH